VKQNSERAREVKKGQKYFTIHMHIHEKEFLRIFNFTLSPDERKKNLGNAIASKKGSLTCEIKERREK
jgi:hypothetical protein